MHPRGLSIADFSYGLPEERIAQHPLDARDASRLLVYRKEGIEDLLFPALPDALPPGALLVLNDTRVVNARLVFERHTGARIEVLCLEPEGALSMEEAMARSRGMEWRCMIGNAKRWREGEELRLRGTTSLGAALTLLAVRSGNEGVRFAWEPADLTFTQVLDRVGHVPLPPYMKRPDAAADRERYNTVFARHQGSVAAPTASLHFSAAVLERLEERGIATTSLTLHVGAGTFAPVKSDRMDGHAMHAEQLRVPRAALEALASALERAAPIVAVGTTALRTLESLYWHGVKIIQGRAGMELDIGQWEPYDHDPADLPETREALLAVIASLGDQQRIGGRSLNGSTHLLIAPGYRFRMTDALVTNFHQPGSTLLLLVAAFIGEDWRRVYDHALRENYRFLSYGDGSLLWRAGWQ